EVGGMDIGASGPLQPLRFTRQFQPPHYAKGDGGATGLTKVALILSYALSLLSSYYSHPYPYLAINFSPLTLYTIATCDLHSATAISNQFVVSLVGYFQVSL